MKDSEILSDLISLAFDSNPKDTSISLRDCIDLLTRTIICESQGIGISEIVAKQHALFADRAPEHPAAVKPSLTKRTPHRPSNLLALVPPKSAKSLKDYLITAVIMALEVWRS